MYPSLLKEEEEVGGPQNHSESLILISNSSGLHKNTQHCGSLMVTLDHFSLEHQFSQLENVDDEPFPGHLTG
jgi:hypothetical protein